MTKTKDNIKGMKYELMTLVQDDDKNAKDRLHKKLKRAGDYTEMNILLTNMIFRARLDIIDKDLPVKIEIKTTKHKYQKDFDEFLPTDLRIAISMNTKEPSENKC